MFKLRKYQEECVNAVIKKFDSLKSQIVQLPTGSGKTVIFWHILKALNKKALIIAPTCELTEQIDDTGKAVVNPENIYLKQRSYWPKNIQYIIMTGQSATFALNGSKFDNFSPEILIVDEAHRSRSKSIEKLINHFSDNGCKVLGLTATPERLDGKSLLDVYEELTYSITLVELINHGYLVDLKCYRINTKHTIENPKYQGSDLAPSILRQLDTDSRNEIILDVYKNRCFGKKTLVFCLNVAHAEAMTSKFVKHGVRSMSIHGGMGKTARRTVLKLFKEGDIDVLCNCQLLTEGFDEPSIEALILARPTKSKGLFCQMIGRGVRPYKGKDFCLIYNLSDEIHNICNFNVLGGISRYNSFQFSDGEKLTDAVERNKLSIKDIEYDYEKFSLYEDQEREPLYAVASQVEMLDFHGIPYMSNITMRQAAYLIFKTALMRSYGIDSRSYWKKWRDEVSVSSPYRWKE